MKKRNVILAGIAVIAIIIFAAFRFRSVSLEKKVCAYLNNASSYNVVCVEEMNPDQSPVVIEISTSSDKQCVVDAMKETKVRFQKFEMGMGFEVALYTVTVSTGEDRLSITVDENNRIHFNANERTYTTTNGSELYRILRDVYNRNK